jgi:hypothetical protein
MDLSTLQPTTYTHLKGNPRAAEAGHFLIKNVNVQNIVALLRGIIVGPSGFVGCYCRALLRDVIAGCYCGTLLRDIITEHYFRALLLGIIVARYCGTLKQGIIAGDYWHRTLQP